MEDQLDVFIKELTKEKCNVERDGEYLSFSVSLGADKIVLQMKIDNTFPFTMPKIIVCEESFNKVKKFPHVNSDRTLCLFDETECFPNIRKPIMLIKACINRAKQIISNGYEKKNLNDISEEYLSYWVRDNDKAEKLLLFGQEISTCQKIMVTKVNESFIAADSQTELERIIAFMSPGAMIERIYPAIIIHMNNYKTNKVLNSDARIATFIGKDKHEYMRYSNYLNNCLRREIPGFVLIQVNNCIIGWKHNSSIKVPNGFRKNNIDFRVAFSKTKVIGSALLVDNCTQEYLMYRGSNQIKKNIDNVAIIGCGSIGSHIAEALASYGVTHFSLIDDDLLSSGNIARHWCGINYIDMHKAEALGKALTSYNLNVAYIPYNCNVINLMNDGSIELKTDLIVEATANFPVEYLLTEQLNEGIISSTILMVWIEPYAIAGHGILIRKPIELYNELFTAKDCEFQFNVLEDSNSYYQKESKCNSSFIPYSAMHVQIFVNQILNDIFQDEWNNNDNVLLTWIGDISKASEYGVNVKSKYRELKAYTILKKYLV